MKDCIDRQDLYKKVAKLEEEALRMVQKFMNSEEPSDIKEWLKWSLILNERTAFKYDIADAAPVINTVEVVRCKDCKYHDGECMGLVYCPHQVRGWVSDYFFCADGDR